MSAGGQHHAVTRQHRGSSTHNTLNRITFVIRLHDRRLKPIPEAHYLVRIGELRYRGRADDDGWLERRIALVADECDVYWSVPRQGAPVPAAERDFEFSLRVYLRIDDSDREEAIRRRLHNAGFPYEAGDAEGKRGAVMSFQMARSDQDLEPTGEIDDATFGALRRIHDEATIPPEDDEAGEAVVSGDRE